MKKALLLALAAALMLASFSAALAEEGKEAGLFELLAQDGESPALVTYAVPVARGVVAAPAALLPEDPDRLIVSDGLAQWDIKAVIPDDTGSIAMVFYDPQEQEARCSDWPLLPWGSDVPAEACAVRCAEGADRGVTDSAEIVWNGKNCLLLTLTDSAPAGSPMLSKDGHLAGIVAAEWAEGINRVLVIPAGEIAAEMSRAAALLGNLPGWGSAPEGLNVTLNKNLATIEWKDMVLPEAKEGETVYIILVDTGNTYLTFFPADKEDRSASLLLTPGRFYIAGAVVSEGTPESLPDSFAVISVPPAEKLTEYGFRPVVTAIAEAPEGELKGNADPVPVTEVTEELLRSGRAYFYSHSTYEVTQTIPDKTLLVTLTDPNGVNYRYESSWVYMQEYNEADVWFLPLQDMGLTGSLDRNGYPAGVYQVAYYVDGFLADSFEFELK